MVQCTSIGTYGALALLRDTTTPGLAPDTAGGWSTGLQYEYKTENIKMQQEHAGGDGTRGTRSRHGGRTRIVAERVTGGWTMEPTPTELQSILEIALGLAPVGNTYGLAEVIPKFGLAVDKVAGVFLYNGCLVNKITFNAQAKGPLTCSIEVEGSAEAQSVNTFAQLGAPEIVDEQPYILADSTLVLNGITTEFKSFTITVDNALLVDRFLNSINRDCIPSTDRIVSFQVELPFNATTLPLHDLPVDGNTGTLTFSHNTSSTVFDFPRLQVPANTPETGSRGNEVMLPLAFNAKSTNTPNDELQITHIV